jgi:hypothetical protein
MGDPSPLAIAISFLVILFFLPAGERDKLNESETILLGLFGGYPVFFMKLGLS